MKFFEISKLKFLMARGGEREGKGTRQLRDFLNRGRTDFMEGFCAICELLGDGCVNLGGKTAETRA